MLERLIFDIKAMKLKTLDIVHCAFVVRRVRGSQASFCFADGAPEPGPEMVSPRSAAVACLPLMASPMMARTPLPAILRRRSSTLWRANAFACSGVLHEILNAIHGEGMDVLECRVETDGDVDVNYFVVQSRGKQKDFDDEKLEDMRHHLQAGESDKSRDTSDE